jgi:hypothetical protein
MTTAQKLARYGATLALALTMVAATAPTSVFATDEAVEEATEQAQEQAYDPSAAPFVLNTVNGGLQTAAGAAEFGLGIGAEASGEQGLGIGVAGTEAGAAAAGLGLGIPAGIVGAQP